MLKNIKYNTTETIQSRPKCASCICTRLYYIYLRIGRNREFIVKRLIALNTANRMFSIVPTLVLTY